ncbi:hypothetical protein [Companilactobacillus metriopterae]|uniref:hypothetical protein n=1 Tax=Companilactobacillus metriopterae TaxID=1909267 RepID=UPI00100BBA3D|nr:hypothetical protein [Companilactobacillus metriopterae]
MKKSIKYAGIAAAALLTVAPIATPIASNFTTTTVQAATNTQLSTSVNNYNGSLTSRKVDTLPVLATDLPTYANGSATMSFKNFEATQLYLNNAQPSKADLDILGDSTKNLQVTVKVSGASTLDDLKIKDAGEGFTYTLSYSYTNDAGNPATLPSSKEITYSKTSTSTTTMKTSNVDYDDSIDVLTKSNTSDVKLSTSTDLKVTNKNDKTISGVTAQPGKIYTTKNAAIKENPSNEYTASKFTTADKTYYQVINVTSSNADFTDYLNKFAAGTKGYTMTVNGESIDASDITITDGAMKVIRAINVADEVTPPTDGWTYSDLNGVVTTGSKDVYTLKNDDNKEVANRALAGGTSWKTNSVRTNAAGEKQYRVATSEWINASDVTYKDSTTTPGTGISNIQNLTGTHVVSLDTPGFVYALYQQDGKTSSRYVAGGTSWATDQTGTDANGVVYYRVSTTEWVMAGQGVNFK